MSLLLSFVIHPTRAEADARRERAIRISAVGHLGDGFEVVKFTSIRSSRRVLRMAGGILAGKCRDGLGGGTASDLERIGISVIDYVFCDVHFTWTSRTEN